MRLTGLVFKAALVVLHLAAVAAAESKTDLGSRVLGILGGPPNKGPRPSAKTALLQCRRPGVENIDLELLRSTGTPEAVMLSAHRDPKKWSDVLKNLLTSYPEHMVSIVLDLGCPGAKETLLQANATKMFGSPYRWLLIYPERNETSMSVETCAEKAEGVLGSLAIFLDSEVISMCRHGQDGGSGLIIEWYRLYLTEDPFIGELGSWTNNDTTIRWTERSSKPMAVRRSNMRKLNLNIGFLYRYKESFDHLEDGIDTRKDTHTKYFWPLMKHVVHMLNGTFIPKWSTGWGYPVNKSMKNWDGIAGMQMRGEADMSGLPVLMDHLRNMVTSFVNFGAPARAIFIFRAPPLTYEANLFALPFPDTLWAAAGGLVATCILLLYLILTAEDIMDEDRPSTAAPAPALLIQVPLERGEPAKPKPFLAPPDKEIDDNMVVPVVTQTADGDGIQAKARLHGSWSDVMLLVFGAICQQGSPVEARTIPGRIVTISMLVGFIFLFTSYSASIVVILQSTSNSIQTVHDLWKSRLPVGAEDVDYHHFYLPKLGGEARRGILKKIMKKNKKNPSGNNLMTLEKGMERVRNDYFAFHSLTTNMFPIISDTWLEHEKCALRAHITNLWYPQNVDINTSKNSPILEVFRLALRKIKESGVQRRELARIVPTKPVCTNPGSNFNSVSVMDSYFALVILSTGLIGSIVIFLLEHLAFRRLKMAAKKAAAAAEAAAVRIRGQLLSSKRI